MFLLLLIVLVSGFNIPLTRDHWTVSYPHHRNMKIDFFCNTSETDYACPYTPPTHPLNWLQLVSPFPGKDQLIYEFAVPGTRGLLELIDVYALVDNNPSLRQNGTFSVRVGSQQFRFPLEEGWNWTNLTRSIDGLSYSSTNARTLELILELNTEVKRTMTVVVIGGISVHLEE